MQMNEKNKRLTAIHQMPKLARMDHRMLKDKKGNIPLLSNLSKKERNKLQKEVNDLIKKYDDIMNRIKTSGAGFPVDKLLRELAIEYNHRYASSGAYTQPLNFNYFESFCHIRLFSKSYAPYVVLTDEVDHLFYLPDYFDYLTSDKSDEFDLSSLIELPEEKSFHFTTNGNINDFSILNADSREFVVSGFSMIRRGNFLHWYLLGGEVFSKEEWKLKCSETLDIDLNEMRTGHPGKEAFLLDMLKDSDNSVVPIALEGTDTAIRTIVAGEIDLTTKKYISRCLMTENENKFNIICDDPEVFDNILDKDERQAAINLMKDQVKHHSIIWELAASMFQLHSYFAFKIGLDKETVDKAKKKVKRIKSNGGRGLESQYKMVSTIEITDSDSPIIRTVVPAHYNTETKGHWRRLNNGSIGVGPDGSRVIGKTWVKRSSTWRDDSDKSSKTIYVKSTIKAAELKIKEYERAANEVNETLNEKSHSDLGVLYVLRCTTMKEEHYKVGWTSKTAEKRAKELSDATGVPTSFVVVNSWQHKDAEALEKNVHMMLEPYRINDRREFFHVSYQIIEKIIESEIERS